MRRSLYEADHQAFRDSVRAFMQRHVVPRHADWERAGIVDRDVWVEAGKQGMLGMDVPEEYGGGGVSDDFRYNAVVDEEITRVGATGLGFGLHNDIVAPYLLDLCTEEQKRRWLPGFCSGELITAIAMSEPGAGSDLQNVRTHARRANHGRDHLNREIRAGGRSVLQPPWFPDCRPGLDQQARRDQSGHANAPGDLRKDAGQHHWVIASPLIPQLP